jgi:hypothetical protein
MILNTTVARLGLSVGPGRLHGDHVRSGRKDKYQIRESPMNRKSKTSLAVVSTLAVLGVGIAYAGGLANDHTERRVPDRVASYEPSICFTSPGRSVGRGNVDVIKPLPIFDRCN